MRKLDDEPSTLDPVRFDDRAVADALLDVFSDAIVIIDVDARIRAFSPSAEAMFGYEARDVLGENVSVLMGSPERERHDGYIRRYLAGGAPRVIGHGRAVTARRRDGSSFPARLEVGETTKGGERLFVGVMHDLTKRTELQRQLDHVRGDLARAARISETMVLSSALAHELNQPLAAMANYHQTIRLMLGDAADVDMRRALEECGSQLSRASGILKGWRDFVATGSGERETVPVERLFDEALAFALMDGEAAGVSVSKSFECEDCEVRVDRIQVEQVLVNLIRNALEAMQRRRTKRVGLAVAEAGAFLELVVHDDGPGLDPALLDTLFHPKSSEKPGGMGFGLPICRMIVEAHGGRIWAGPSPFGGAAFHFTLPRAKRGGEAR